ncbi:MAG: helix-turn-helix transcriptional regulator [Burkholderiales bacterium]|nr:MAG: helix-turn-helix transcriptional regulator [Burkholderiales bacterium]
MGIAVGLEHSTSLDRLTRLVYSAGLDASKWSEFLSSLSNAVGYAALALHTHDYRRDRNVSLLMHNYDTPFRESYRSYYDGRNPWNKRVARAPVGQAIASPKLLASEELRSTEFYNDWIRPQDDIGTGAGITIYRDRSRFLRLSANTRFKDAETTVDALVLLLNGLAPHMRASFEVAQVLGRNRTGPHYRQAIEMAEVAVAVLDQTGRVCVHNALWDELMREGRYMRLQSAGRVKVLDADVDDAVGRFLAGTRDGRMPVPNSMPLRSEKGPTATLSISTFLSADSTRASSFVLFPDDEPAALVVVSLSRPGEPLSAATFAERHGLTGAESALLKHLLSGLSLRDFADRRGASLNTARSQMKSLLNKTGTVRQAELVALASRLHQR